MNRKEATQKILFNPGSSQQLDVTFSPSLTSPTAIHTPTLTATTATVTATPTPGPRGNEPGHLPRLELRFNPENLKDGYERAKIVFSDVNTQAHSIYRSQCPDTVVDLSGR